MKPVAWRFMSDVGLLFSDDPLWIERTHIQAGTGPVEPLFTSDQLRAAKVEALREAASRWSFTGKTNSGYEQVVREEELLHMADEIEKGEQ